MCAEYLRFSGPVPARAHLAAPSPTAARAQGVFRFQLREDMAQRRHNLTSSEMERAHWLSLLLTSVINKADVTVKDVRVCLHDTASKIGGSGAQGLPSTFGLQLSELLLVAGPFRV